MSNNARPPVNIGQVIYEATAFDPKNWTGVDMNPDLFPASVEKLLALLNKRNIDCLLVDGIAMLQYVPNRNTKDIDLIISATALKKLPEIRVTEQNLYFAHGEFENLPVDFLLTKNTLFKKVRQKHSEMREYVEQTIRTATIEGLLLLKLYALPSLYRQQDWFRVNIYRSDIGNLLVILNSPLEKIFAELALHVSESDLKEIRKAVVQIQQARDLNFE